MKFLLLAAAALYYLNQKDKLALTPVAVAKGEAISTYKTMEEALSVNSVDPTVYPIMPIAAEGYAITPSDLPSSPPGANEFPAPTSSQPLPILVWSVAAHAWVGECPAEGVAIMTNSAGRKVTVSASCPVVSWMENGVPRMEPNAIRTAGLKLE